jgi:hypothetical protein
MIGEHEEPRGQAIDLAAGLAHTREVIDRVRRLHRRNEHTPNYCVTCRAPWPCATAASLEEVTE